jgi:hypothetical protein
MTYGANGGQLRDALATLLRQHRILQRLGSAGSHTIQRSPRSRNAQRSVH